MPILMVDPRNTSKICPIHNASIEYGEDRIGICSKGGEKWHREVVALINIYFKALEALYEGSAQKGWVFNLRPRWEPGAAGLNSAHEPIEIPRSLRGGGNPRCHRARNPVDQEIKQHKQMNINDNQQPSGDKRSYIRGEGKAGNP